MTKRLERKVHLYDYDVEGSTTIIRFKAGDLKIGESGDEK